MQVRVSIGNIVNKVIVEETGAEHHVGILNSASFRKGKRIFGAIGGAVELTERGKSLFEEFYDAKNFEGNDARFEIDDAHLEVVFDLFSFRNEKIFEIDPSREILGELVNEKIPGFGPVLSVEQIATGTNYSFSHTIRQRLSENGGTSAREKEGVPSRRLFHLFDLHVLQSVFEIMRQHPSIHVFTTEELDSTKGGSTKGQTADGVAIADNIGLV